MCFRFAGDNKLFPQDVDKIFKRVGKQAGLSWAKLSTSWNCVLNRIRFDRVKNQ